MAILQQMAPMHIVEGGLDDPCVITLLHVHLARSYTETAPDSAHALEHTGLRAPKVTFWCAWEDEALAGVGAALLRHIIAAAHAAGLSRLSLETGSWPYIAPARRFYGRYGFVECPPFGNYRPDPNSVFMTLALPCN
jgi:putative acetyltransferase